MDKFIYEIFRDIPRLGPGCMESTKEAFYILPKSLRDGTILDIGCGNGFQTFTLASLSAGMIIALDNHSAYLRELAIKAKKLKLNEKIHVINGDMANLPFSEAEFDVIWSEGAIYNIGFKQGLSAWKSYLKSGGFLVVSELTWFKNNPPNELLEFWANEYPNMENNSTLVKHIEESGYELVQHFELPEFAWWDEFYKPLEKRISKLSKKYKEDEEKMKLMEMTQNEIDLYRKYSEYYGYMFYIMKKL